MHDGTMIFNMWHYLYTTWIISVKYLYNTWIIVLYNTCTCITQRQKMTYNNSHLALVIQIHAVHEKFFCCVFATFFFRYYSRIPVLNLIDPVSFPVPLPVFNDLDLTYMCHCIPRETTVSCCRMQDPRLCHYGHPDCVIVRARRRQLNADRRHLSVCPF